MSLGSPPSLSLDLYSPRPVGLLLAQGAGLDRCARTVAAPVLYWAAGSRFLSTVFRPLSDYGFQRSRPPPCNIMHCCASPTLNGEANAYSVPNDCTRQGEGTEA